MIEHLKRTKQIIIRVSPDEFIQLKKLCSRPRLATWIRETCLTQRKQLRPVKIIDKNLLVWLSRMNSNLNQIAKYINVQNKAENQINMIKILSELALIRSSLNELLKTQYADKNIQK